MNNKLRIRHTRASDIEPLICLQQQVYPDMASWHAQQLLHQLELFPHGQLVAELEGELVGAASSLLILWKEWKVDHSWEQITAHGSFDTHNPQGHTLYGAEVFVDPARRGAGIGHALYQARRQICRALNLKRIIACGRLPGYCRYQQQYTPLQYVQRVIWGDIRDPVLSFQLHEGFNFCGIVKDYIPEDTESAGNASLIVWLNSDYDPARAGCCTMEEML